MPDVDGVELLRHLRSDAAYKHVPVVSEPLSPAHGARHCQRSCRPAAASANAPVCRCTQVPGLWRQGPNLSAVLGAVMSANEHTETVFECIREGAEDYLLKPVTKKEVQNIWQHVWRRQQQQAAQSGRSQAMVSALTQRWSWCLADWCFYRIKPGLQGGTATLPQAQTPAAGHLLRLSRLTSIHKLRLPLLLRLLSCSLVRQDSKASA